MPKEKLKYFEIEDDIYRENFHLFVNVPRKQFKNWLIEVHGELSEDTIIAFDDAKAMMVWQYSPYYYLWIEEFNWSIEHQGVLIHELSHFVDKVLSNAGISIGIKNTEVRAYYLEYIFMKVYSQLKPLYTNTKKQGKP